MKIKMRNWKNNVSAINKILGMLEMYHTDIT